MDLHRLRFAMREQILPSMVRRLQQLLGQTRSDELDVLLQAQLELQIALIGWPPRSATWAGAGRMSQQAYTELLQGLLVLGAPRQTVGCFPLPQALLDAIAVHENVSID